MGLYEPITQYLSEAKGRSVQVTFGELEKLLNRELPKSAYRYREWWSNNPTGHSHARSWVDAGWRTEQVDLEKRALVFARSGIGTPESVTQDRPSVPDPFGMMRGSVVFAPGYDPTEPTGEIWEAGSGPEND